MKSMLFRASLILGCLLLPAHAAKKPNLIAIVTDDQAAWTLGCYGGRELATPHLDGLAARGVRFTNAFVHTPVCSPSRATYLTGLLPTQLGITDWLTDGQAKKAGISPETPTWPSVLAANGYSTGLIGKWHVGSGESSLPWNNGIREFTGDLGGGWPPTKVNFITEKGEKLTPVGFSVEICTDLAIDYLDAHKDKPFALLLHYREPHAVFIPMPEVDMEASRNAKIQSPGFPDLRQPYTDKQRRNYYASIAALDRNIGRLLEHLEKAGLAENTIITFTSDHGYNVGEHGIEHKGNGRWITNAKSGQPAPNMYESSLRVPLIVSGPGVKDPGRTAGTWVTNRDMFATSIALLGLGQSAQAPAHSRDFSPVVRGESPGEAAFPHELFAQYDLVNFPVKAEMRVIRNDQWKLLLRLDDPSQSELYRIEKDPTERDNLYGNSAHADIVKSLTAAIRKHMEEIKDPLLGKLE